MGSRRAAAAAALAILFGLAGCASAGKRLEQGLEEEAQGDYLEAALRYADAVEKDPALTEARERLVNAADSAFAVRMRRAERLASAGGAVTAADELRALDRLVRRADQVGVRLTSPGEYDLVRRETFDQAISELNELAWQAQARADWNEARGAYQRIRRDMEPSASQHTRSIEAEAAMLLEWARVEESRGRPRRGFDLAGEALDLTPMLPRDIAEPATSLQARALATGTRALAVFPLTATRPAREAMESDLVSELSDLLELDYWREPPLFVVVVDPVAVRQATRRLAPGGRGFRPERILREVGADFGAAVEVTSLEAVRDNPRPREREARTADGRDVTYVEEESTLRVTVEARVFITDPEGREVADFSVRATGNDRFRRGIYRGDPRDLELSRNERRLFDADVLARQRADVESLAVSELAQRVADRVFSLVLSKIP